MRIDHKTKVALLRFVTALISADKVIDTSEIQQLTGLELTYGIDRSLMPEASQLTVAQAAEHLRSLDKATRQPIYDDLLLLAGADKVCNPAEALLLLTLRYDTISMPDHTLSHSGLGNYVVYVESEYCEERHQELNAQCELLQLLLEHYGMNLLYIEKMIAAMRNQEEGLVKKVLGYSAPQLDDAQIDHAYERLNSLTSVTFCNQLLMRDLHLSELRDIEPSLLVNTPGGFLLIPLKESITAHIKQLLADYSELVTPGQTSARAIGGSNVLPYSGYYRLFLDFVLKTEPLECRIVCWPNKSDFSFPEAGRTLHLNQQEASLYTLILLHTYGHNQKGLPLSYTAAQKRIEAEYRTIYCRKKLVETDEVIFPDNLAPIRAKIERKMREQLAGVSNIEDYIPRNVDRCGFYTIQAPKARVLVKPDSLSEEVPVAEYKW